MSHSRGAVPTTSKYGLKRLLTSKDGTKPQPLGHGHAHVYQQHAYRASLLVTQELDNAIARCKAKVEEVSQECCRKNRRFRDIEFDLDYDQDRCLHGLHMTAPFKFYPSDVLRVSQIFGDPQFIIDGTTSSDIKQGDLFANCWFLSAVATLSTMPGLIDKICVARDEKAGVYGFIFFRDGEWADVVIDDQLFTKVPKYETLSFREQSLYHNDKDLYDKVARKGGKTLYFGRSSQENETWVPLLEKAYAKFHGDYASLEGGHAFEGIEDLTGGVSRVISTNEIVDKDHFWREDLMKAAKDRLFGCYFNSIAGRGVATHSTKTHGLLGAHSYSVLGAVEYKGKRFLKIRDPWVKSEWTGRWSYRSKKWTDEWHEVLRLLDHKFSDDGAFIMEYKDFLKTWYAVERTLIFDSSWLQSSHWLKVSSRTLPCAWQFGDVSFTFSLPKASPAVVVLSQSDTRFYNDVSRYMKWTFDFVLYRKGEERVLGRSEFSVLYPRSVTLTQHLDAGEYVLHVRLDRDLIPPTPPSPNPNVPQMPQQLDYRKLSKILSERARSMSIAENFDPRSQSSHLVVPPETFAGRDLTQVKIATKARGKKVHNVKFSPHPAQLNTLGLVDKGQVKRESSPGKGLVPTSGPKPPSPPQAVMSSKARDAVQGDIGVPWATRDAIRVSSDLISRASKPKTVVPTGVKIKRKPKPPHAVGPIHNGVVCDGCGGKVVGVRWRCLECDDYDLCEECHVSRMQSLRHSVKHKMLRKAHTEEPIAVHEGVICDCCKSNPLLGVRWKCLVCHDYDLCDACHAFGRHDEHKMVKIITPADAKKLKEEVSNDLGRVGNSQSRTVVEKTRDTTHDDIDDDTDIDSNYYSFSSDYCHDPYDDSVSSHSDNSNYSEDFNTTVVLGLRVYTKADAPVKISGQLRQENMTARSKSRGTSSGFGKRV